RINLPHRTTAFFDFFKKGGWCAGYRDEKITVIRGLLFYDRGAPLTELKRSRQTLKKPELQNRQMAARPFDQLVRPSNTTKAPLPPNKTDRFARKCSERQTPTMTELYHRSGKAITPHFLNY
ncbi:MAG: hypothetical protein Q7U57_05210, partial [Methylovulum sp.]|nr:hypothetical protein [Methylovulum sp.]